MKLQEEYDMVIIGSGLGGLVAGNIFAKEGYSVCILEKNNQYGGNLQTFVRDKTIFDTGVHYIGGLEEGQNMYQYFKYLGIMDDLNLQKMDVDGFDIIAFGDEEKTYKHSQGYDNFIATLVNDFPDEEPAIREYCAKLQEVTQNFPMYCVKLGSTYYEDQRLFELSAKDYIASVTENETLRAVLAGSNLLYAGEGSKTPFYVHALSVDSYIQSSYRCINGGSQITKYLIKRLFENGGHAFKHHEVVEINSEGKEAHYVRVSNGAIVKGKNFISNVDPKVTLDILKTDVLRKSYVKRVKGIESTIAAFSLHIVLKPKSFKYRNHNYYYYKDKSKVWGGVNYTQESWPDVYMMSMAPKKNDDGYADNLTVMGYMNFDEMKPWEDTHNTVAKKNDRGQSYEEFKAEKAEIFLQEIEKKFPNIRDCIESVYTSTPLSYRDYIGCNRGSMYGYAKDVELPMRTFISPRTKINNLFFTGQSINMHGILGVTISGVLTSSEILGKEYLMNKVWEANKAETTN